MFSATLGLSLTHIPYKGTAQAVADVVDGRVHLVIADQPTLAPHIQSGRLVVLATTGSERSAALAQLPALAEVAAGFDVQPWQGLFGPAGLPAGLAQKVSTDVAAVLRRPELQEKLAAAGIEAAASTPELFAAHVRREVERWTAAARSAGIQPE
jgi:tripartite-type tricarboxylate transporter receptor subunit TctC